MADNLPTSVEGMTNATGKTKDNTRLLGYAAVAGDALDLYGSLQAQKIARKAAAYRIREAQIDFSNLNFQAQQVSDIGNLKAVQQEGKAMEIAGEQSLVLAGQGVDLSSADAVALRLGTRTRGMIDAETIRHNATRQAFGLKAEGEGLMAKAYMESAAKKSEAGSSILKSGLNLGKSLLNLA